MNKLRLMAIRGYLAIAGLKNPKKKRKLFLPVFLAITVLLLTCSTGAVFAEGEYGSGFQTGVGGFLKSNQELVQWMVCGAITAYLSANVLQWVVNNQTEMVQFNGNFIKNGLITTQGLADMLLILAFVIASFGIIFKVREFEAKKTVTTIVLTAIFTHFGTLVVKMMVDIGNIAITTIVGNNQNLIVNATLPLVKDALLSAGLAIGGMATFAGFLSVPYANIAAVIAGVAGASSVGASLMGFNNPITTGISLAVINFLVKGVLELIACYTLSGVFMAFILLFLTRVFMISILAVISPLAIMAYALPMTRRFYSQWWNSLLRWSFLGVWTLFFLMLGMGSEGFIMPTTLNGITGTLSDGIFSQVIVDSGMLFYLFLIVYLALVRNMAETASGGMANIFKMALMGAGAAAVTNVVKPVTNTMRDRAIKDFGNIDAKIKSGQPVSTAEKLLMHGSGLTAKALEEKQFSNYASMFSGDHKKAMDAAKDFKKSFDFSKLKTDPGQFSDIGPMMETAIKDVGKDNTIQSIMKEGGKASMEKGIWAMQNAKTEDLSQLFTALGPNAGSYLNYAVKKGWLTSSQMQTIARNTNALASSSELREHFIKMDKGNINFDKAKSFMGLGADISPQQKTDADDMTARIMSLKGSLTSRDAFKKIDSGIFSDPKNLDAMLIGGSGEMFGYAATANIETSQKLRQAAKSQFESITRGNPELARYIGQNPALYEAVLPDAIKNSPQYADEKTRIAYVKNAIEKGIDFEKKKAEAAGKK